MIVHDMLQKGMTRLFKAEFKKMYKQATQEMPNVPAEELWDRLNNARHLVPCVAPAKSIEPRQPCFGTAVALNEIFDIQHHSFSLELPEKYDVANFQKYLLGNPSRKLNVDLLINFYDQELSLRKSGRSPGNLPAGQRDFLKTVAKTRDKLKLSVLIL